jgi:hypothetical protein
MILLVHLLLGALIGQKISNPVLAIILAFLGHYFLDFFPHIEYPIENIKSKNWKKFLPDVFKIFLDFSAGIILIFTFSNNNPLVYICAFFSILPDGLTVLHSIFPNKILEKHSDFHRNQIHFFTHKKIPLFWRIFSQVVAVILVLLFFFLKVPL